MKTIADYVKNNSQAQRQQHVNLSSPCVPSVLKVKSQLGKAGDYTTNIMGMINAKQALKELLQLSGSTNYNIHACHLCDNNSQTPNGFVCMNPEHLYFGTVTENNNDRSADASVRGGKRGGKIGPKKQLANGTHNTQQDHTCPRCNRVLRGIRGLFHINSGTKGCPK